MQERGKRRTSAWSRQRRAGLYVAIATSMTAALALLSLAGCGKDPAPSELKPDPASAAPASTFLGPRVDALTGDDWNAGQIDWQSYEAGMALAKAKNKPVCLIISANWCPHCKNYKRVFEDPKIVQRARDFVMIHINSDDEFEVSRKYARDGSYVPRTYFLAPDGAVAEDVHAPRPKYIYFYDEHDPSSLLAGMDTMKARGPK